jgi:hypothetical protein
MGLIADLVFFDIVDNIVSGAKFVYFGGLTLLEA